MPISLPDARQLSDEALGILRLRALRGIELGFTQADLADVLGVCRETISRWWSAYLAEGLRASPGDRTGRPLGSGRFLSDEQAQRIKGLIDDNSPEELGIAAALWTRRAIRDLIRKESHVELALRTVGLYLRRWGYTSKKPARHARRQDPEEVRKWLEETYPALETRAAREGAEILWTDEVGVAADHHPGCGYARKGERATMEVPGPHIRVNQIAAISNEGAVRFMTYKGSLDAAVFLVFLAKVVEGAKRKVFLIADRLQAHETPAAAAWVEAHKDRIEVFYLPGYSPDRNPVEYPNNDMKGEVNKAGLPDNKEALLTNIVAFMTKLANAPRHVINYFLHPRVQYASSPS
ncbi:MAG: IS630 family transposase [Gemmataceae bacterium]